MPNKTSTCPGCRKKFFFSGSHEEIELARRKSWERHKALHQLFDPNPSMPIDEVIKDTSAFLRGLSDILRQDYLKVIKVVNISRLVLKHKEVDYGVLLKRLTNDLKGNDKGGAIEELSSSEQCSLERIMVSFSRYQRSSLLATLRKQRVLRKIITFHGPFRNQRSKDFAEGLIDLFQKNYANELLNDFERIYSEQLCGLERISLEALSSAIDTMRLCVETRVRLPCYLTVAAAYKEQMPDKKFVSDALKLFTDFIYLDISKKAYDPIVGDFMAEVHSEYLKEARDHLETAPFVVCDFYQTAIKENRLDLSEWQGTFDRTASYLTGRRPSIAGTYLVDPNTENRELQDRKAAIREAGSGLFSEKHLDKSEAAFRKRTTPGKKTG